jgi:hypothetical protein
MARSYIAGLEPATATVQRAEAHEQGEPQQALAQIDADNGVENAIEH